MRARSPWRVVCAASDGCGYRVAGRANTLRPTIQTIAVPAFENRTSTYRIEQRLTEAVVHELVADTRYHVVSRPEDGDAVLRGVILAIGGGAVVYDATSGRATTILVTVTMQARLSRIAAPGNVLRIATIISFFREPYEIAIDVPSFFEESGPAMDRVARDFAEAPGGRDCCRELLMAVISAEQVVARLKQGKPAPAILLLGADCVTCREAARERDRGDRWSILLRGTGPWQRFSAGDDELTRSLGQAQTVPMLAPRQVVMLTDLEAVEQQGEVKREAAIEELTAYLNDPAPFTVLILEASESRSSADEAGSKLLRGKVLVVSAELPG